MNAIIPIEFRQDPQAPFGVGGEKFKELYKYKPILDVVVMLHNGQPVLLVIVSDVEEAQKISIVMQGLTEGWIFLRQTNFFPPPFRTDQAR